MLTNINELLAALPDRLKVLGLSLQSIEFDVCFAGGFREARHVFLQEGRELFGRVADGELVQQFELGFDVRRMTRCLEYA